MLRPTSYGTEVIGSREIDDAGQATSIADPNVKSVGCKPPTGANAVRPPSATPVTPNVTIVDAAIITAADYPVPSYISADDISSYISMNNISAYVSPHNRIAMNSAATIEVASAPHPMK
jgi:hypothetical protein